MYVSSSPSGSLKNEDTSTTTSSPSVIARAGIAPTASGAWLAASTVTSALCAAVRPSGSAAVTVTVAVPTDTAVTVRLLPRRSRQPRPPESSDADAVTAGMEGSSLTVTAVAVGTATVTVTAADPEGLTAAQSAEVTVEAPNQAPEAVGAIPARAMTEGDEVVVDVSPFFSDPDGTN